MRTCLILLVALLMPGRLEAHGGTTHSGDMAVDNTVAIARDAITLTQLHTCSGKLAADLWAATDADGDGKLSDTEWTKCVDDSRTVYQQWCRLEVDWKTVLPARVDVKLTSFPRTRPATFAGAPLVLEHVALYPTEGLGSVRNVAINCTSLNARTITSKVRCEPGLRVETSSLGAVQQGGATVTGLVQEEGSPDQFALVVLSEATPATPASAGPRGLASMTTAQQVELATGLVLIFFGVYHLVSSAVALGRARATQAPGGLGSIAASFGVIFLGISVFVHALVAAGCVILRF